MSSSLFLLVCHNLIISMD